MAKTKKEMLPGIRVKEEERERTKEAAEKVDEKLSEYILNAVKKRNKEVLNEENNNTDNGDIQTT